MAATLKIGDIITNGSSAGKIIEHVTRDPNWKTAGVRIANIALEKFGGNVGMTQFIPDYLLSSWRSITPGQSYPVTGTGGAVIETYRWSPDYSLLQRVVIRATI